MNRVRLSAFAAGLLLAAQPLLAANTPPPERWTVIFRSADPALWNTDKSEADDRFAMPLNKLRDRVSHLRMTRMDTQEFVILKMDMDSGAGLGGTVKLGNFTWNGTCRFERLGTLDVATRSNYLLGIARMDWIVKYGQGVVVLNHKPRETREGCGGWGFAKAALTYSNQAYAWGGQSITKTVFEIAVTSGQLLPVECEHVLNPEGASAATTASTQPGKPPVAAPATPMLPRPLGAPVAPSLSVQAPGGTTTLPRHIAKDYEFTATSRPYLLSGIHAVEKGHGVIKITVAPGVEIRGGDINLDTDGELIINGTPGKPVILRGVTLRQDLNRGGVTAKWVIFDQCTFEKGGKWYNYNSSKWVYDSCLFYNSTFPDLKGVDYGFQLIRCALVSMSMPEIVHNRPKDKPFDHMRLLRTDWNMITGCQFVDCEIAPTVAWCAQESNFMGCTFTRGETFESSTPTEAAAFVADTAGDLPHKVWRGYSEPLAPLKVAYAAAPFPTVAFPALARRAGSPIPKLSEDAKLLAWLSSKPVAGGSGVAKQSFPVVEKKTPTDLGTAMVKSREAEKLKEETEGPRVAEKADMSLQKDARKFARMQCSIKGLYVRKLDNGQRLGGAQDIVVAAQRASADIETICEFTTEVAKETRISMEEAERLLKVRHPVWQAGYTIRFSYGDKYTLQAGGSAGGAFSVLLLSLLDGMQIDPGFAMTGDVTVDGKIREVSSVAEKLRGAALDKCAAVAIPDANKENLGDLAILYSPAMLWSLQIFSIATLDEAAALARTDRAPNLAKAMELFSQVQRSLPANAAVQALRSPATLRALQQVVRLAPNHASAEYMLRAANNQLPGTLSLSASLGEIWSASVPVHGQLFDNRTTDPEKSKRYGTAKLPADAIKLALDRLNWLDKRVHPKAQDLRIVMLDYIAHMDLLRRQSGMRGTTYSLNLAKRDRVLSEFVKLGTDRNTLEELMH